MIKSICMPVTGKKVEPRLLPKQSHFQVYFEENQLLFKSSENWFFEECIFYKSRLVNITRETLDGDHLCMRMRVGDWLLVTCCWVLVAGCLLLVGWMIGCMIACMHDDWVHSLRAVSD